VILGFCRKVVEICALLGCYTICSSNYLPTVWDILTAFKGAFSTPEDGTERLSRIICKELHCVTSQKCAELNEQIVYSFVLDGGRYKVSSDVRKELCKVEVYKFSKN
jgi:hypothetical protein